MDHLAHTDYQGMARPNLTVREILLLPRAERAPRDAALLQAEMARVLEILEAKVSWCIAWQLELV